MSAADVSAMVEPAAQDALRAATAVTAEQSTPRVRDAARHTLDHPSDIALSPVAAVTDTVLKPVARDAALVLQVDDAELQGFRSLTAAFGLTMGIAFAGCRRGVEASAALGDIDC